jgi:hypothetical protein
MSVVGGPRKPISLNTKSMNNELGSSTLYFVGDTTMESLGGLDTFSFSTWVKFIASGYVGTTTIAKCFTARDLMWHFKIEVGKNGPEFVVIINNSPIFRCTPPSLNTWINISFAMKTTKGQPVEFDVWFDGVSQINSITPGGLTTPGVAGTSYLLADEDNISSVMRMNQVAFFDYQLKQTNVDTIYNGGCPTDFSSLTPVVYIKDLESATYDGIEWTALDTGSLGGNFTSINLNGVITDSPCP